MLNVTSGQFLIFVYFFTLGAIVSISYLLLQTLIKTKNKYITFIFDFIFSTLSFLSFFVLNIVLNYGEFRLYVIFALLLGIIFTSKIFFIIVAKRLKKGYTTTKLEKE